MKSFPDEVEITVRGGQGGAGSVSFLRSRHKPQGRPDGGAGGAGGDVILEASSGSRTLSLFKRRKIFQADKGGRGQSRDRHGKNGPPLVIPVPLGTLVYHPETRELLGELLQPGERLPVAKGGRGGKGNAHFVSSRLRSPRFSQPGEKGEERKLRLELQILADVGLVGAPNAGKTTLLKALTASKARVGDFPFTTLSPQLGALTGEVAEEPLILAEIPGLIPGAHLGKGLGHRFLRHIKRTRLLLMVIDLSRVDPDKPLAPLKELEAEMDAFDLGLTLRPRLVVLNKTDLLPPDFPRDTVVRAYEARGWRTFTVSAKKGEGIPDLRAALWTAAPQMEKEPATD
ncbi:MAG: Obg family GTPase CgtA [Thermodesulfobacteriota bacterium]